MAACLLAARQKLTLDKHGWFLVTAQVIQTPCCDFFLSKLLHCSVQVGLKVILLGFLVALCFLCNSKLLARFVLQLI